MKHAPPHHPHPKPAPQKLSGFYRQPIYSPKGDLEGLLLDVDGAPAQVVVDPYEQAAEFNGIRAGQRLELEVAPAPPSPKGEAAHAVYRLHAVITIDGVKPNAAAPTETVFSGRVLQLNYAKHGEPNGVVLETGDFIHLRPQGFRAAGLKVGDAVRAEGVAQPMSGGGNVVEASRINDIAIEPKPPKPHGPTHRPGHRPGHRYGPASKVHAAH